MSTNDIGYRGKIDFEDQIRGAKAIHSRGGKVVILTGGSAAFGWHADGDETSIVSRLNSLLSHAGRAVGVFNLAMGYYTSGQELAASIFYGGDLGPDLFVVIDGFNDLARAFHRNYRNNPKESFFFNEVRRLYPVKFESSYLDMAIGPENFDRITLNYKQNMGRLAAFARGLDKRVVLAVQPIQGFHNRCTKDPWPRPFTGMVSKYHEMVEAAMAVGAENANVLLVDLTKTFAGSSEPCANFLDQVHLTPKGQEQVAQMLLPAIVGALEPR